MQFISAVDFECIGLTFWLEFRSSKSQCQKNSCIHAQILPCTYVVRDEYVQSQKLRQMIILIMSELAGFDLGANYGKPGRNELFHRVVIATLETHFVRQLQTVISPCHLGSRKL